MTLPASPPISMQQILTEFGAPLGTGLLAMVRGGAYVANHAGTAGIPTAAPIDVLDFLGAYATFVDPGSRIANGLRVGAGVCNAGITFNNDGTVTRTQNGTNTALANWLTGGTPSAYDVRITGGVGTVPAGSAVGTWLNLGTSRGWTLTQGAGVGSVGYTATIEIGLAGSGVASWTGSLSLYAERT